MSTRVSLVVLDSRIGASVVAVVSTLLSCSADVGGRDDVTPSCVESKPVEEISKASLDILGAGVTWSIEDRAGVVSSSLVTVAGKVVGNSTSNVEEELVSEVVISTLGKGEPG